MNKEQLRKIEQLRKVAKKVWWICDIRYPSNYAQAEGMGKDYLCISGDGLVMALFLVDIDLKKFKLTKINDSPLLTVFKKYGIKLNKNVNYITLKKAVNYFANQNTAKKVFNNCKKIQLSFNKNIK